MIKIPKIENLFPFVAVFTDLLPILFFLIFIDINKRERKMWVLILYIVGCIITNFFDYYIPYNSNKRYFHSFVTLYEYCFISYFFWLCIKNRTFKKAIEIALVVFAVFLAYYTYTIKVLRIDSVPIGIETIVVLIYSFYFFYEQMNNTQILFIYNEYPFWIISGTMLYLAGSFFIFIFANDIPRDKVTEYWLFINVFYILRNIFFIIGILVFALQTKLTNPHLKKLYKN